MLSPRLARKIPICPLSPLKSPVYKYHFEPVDYNTHWPDLISEDHPVYRKMLICKDGVFRAAVDVHDFHAEEISVKVIGHTIHVDAEHDEREDTHSLISRKLNRTFVLPPSFDMDLVETFLDAKIGILKVRVVPPKPDIPERIISITMEEAPQQSS